MVGLDLMSLVTFAAIFFEMEKGNIAFWQRMTTFLEDQLDEEHPDSEQLITLLICMTGTEHKISYMRSEKLSNKVNAELQDHLQRGMFNFRDIYEITKHAWFSFKLNNVIAEYMVRHGYDH